MDLKKKVERALKQYFNTDRIKLENEDGVYGYIVSPKFRRKEMYDRQVMIDKALRAADSGLKPEEVRKVVIIAALTPEEHAGHGLEYD